MIFCTWVRQGYIDPVVSNEKTISLISATPVAAAAPAVVAGFAFLAGDGAFSAFFSLVATEGFWNTIYKLSYISWADNILISASCIVAKIVSEWSLNHGIECWLRPVCVKQCVVTISRHKILLSGIIDSIRFMYMYITFRKCDWRGKMPSISLKMTTNWNQDQTSISFHTWKPFFINIGVITANAENVLLTLINI